MGGKSGGSSKVPVTLYYGSVHFGICHGPVDSINRMYFNEQLGWNGVSEFPKPPLPTYWIQGLANWRNHYYYRGPEQSEKVLDTNALESSGFKAAMVGAFIGGKLTWRDWEFVVPTGWQLGPVKTRTITGYGLGWESSGGGEGNVFTQSTVWLFDRNETSGVPTVRSDSGSRYSTSQGVTLYTKEAWEAETSPEPTPEPVPPGARWQQTIYINAPELFGGLKKEGGVAGYCHVMMGDLTQLVPDDLARKVGRTQATMPAYRGVVNAWFFGDPSFYWSCNSNRIPDVWINVTRMPVGLDPAIARIGDDANAVHIIFEAMTNADWGMGAPVTSFNMATWQQAARTIYDEKFGLSMIWSDQMEIEKFVSEVLDHIEASVFVHPRSGLFEIKLIRDDYDENLLRTFNPDNALLSNFQRKAWGETINEIVVTYKNPENEEDLSFAMQDTANIGMQGAVITDNRNYYGIRNSELAARVAERDLRSASAPLCSCDIEVNRSAWDLVPGDVVRVTWPEYGLQNLVMRVGPVDYGRPGEPRIRSSLVEDIFFMPDDSYFIPPTTEWEDPRESAVPMMSTKIISIPYYYLMQALGITDEHSTEQPIYPETAAVVLGSTFQLDAQDFELMTPGVDAVGNLEYRSVGFRELTGLATTTADMVREVHTYMKFETPTPKGGPTLSGFALIGDGSDFETELVALESFDSDLGWRLRRGVLDTTPKPWPKGTNVRFIDGDSNTVDETIRADMETVEYKLLTRTSLNLLELDAAPIESEVLNGRPHYPFRPANVRMNTILWGAPLVDGRDGVNLSWSTRSRLQETSVINVWSDGQVIPEVGQTTNVRFYDHEGQVIEQFLGITATSVSLAFSKIPGPSVRYMIESERDGLTSLQNVDHEFDVCGYGMNYGNYYGGKP